MRTSCIGGVLALLCFTCVTSYVGAEDNSRLHSLISEDDDDGFLRHTRQFYRFGRAFSPLWNSEDDSVNRNNRFGHWPGYPISPVLDDDVFSRHSRQFYRFGRAYPPYQDKRFLRFGRSHQPDFSEYTPAIVLHSDEPLYRMRRSSKADSESEVLHLNVRSAEKNHQSHNTKNSATGKDIQKRDAVIDGANNSDHISYNDLINDEGDLDKRFMRFGKRFMRFGRGDEDYEKRFMRFGKSLGYDQDLNKRFMRFGKSIGDDQEFDKRFMRFGKSLGEDQDFQKRFMRFGKRFMRFGRGNEGDESEEKRFMRFGKSRYDDSDVDKRFMRFGKSLPGIGSDADDDILPTKFIKSIDDKRFMRFGKRSKRTPSSKSEATATS